MQATQYEASERMRRAERTGEEGKQVSTGGRRRKAGWKRGRGDEQRSDEAGGQKGALGILLGRGEDVCGRTATGRRRIY